MARTKSLLPIDQLNNLNSYLRIKSASNEEVDADEIIDSVLDLLIMAYVFGNDSLNEDLGTDLQINDVEMGNSINKKIDGKTYADRIKQYTSLKDEFDKNTSTGIDVEKIIRVADTECHRVYCESQMNSAKSSGLNPKKTWVTMLDEKVRDTHDFLEGVTVEFGETFNTFDGDRADYPGGFEKPENNINCRCEIKFSI